MVDLFPNRRLGLRAVQLPRWTWWLPCRWKNGLTWVHKAHDCEHNLDFVGCIGQGHFCNPYYGDTSCLRRRPVLCINQPRVATVLRPPHPVYAHPFYSGWARGFVKVTQPIWGCYLWNQYVADRICEAHFGCGWRMASHHEGRYLNGMTDVYHTYLNGQGDYSTGLQGGWNWWAYGNIRQNWEWKYDNFWVRIYD